MSGSEEEVFEINDFTTASDWEKFVSDLEGIIRQWRLHETSHAQEEKDIDWSQYTWSQKTERIKFARTSFAIHHVLGRLDKRIIMEMDKGLTVLSDFPFSCPPITRLFGSRELLYITCTNTGESLSQDKIKLLTSSALLALFNTGCHGVPVFVDVARNSSLFSGVSISKDVRTLHEMVYLVNVPGSYSYLSSLLTLFKEKLGYSATNCPVPVQVSVKFEKSFSRWPEEMIYSNHPLDWEDFPKEVVQTIDFETYEEPCKILYMTSLWTGFTEEVISESPHHSDLDPTNSPDMVIKVESTPSLKTSVQEYMLAITSIIRPNTHSLKLHQKIMNGIQGDRDDVLQVLDRLAAPSSGVDADFFTAPVKTLTSQLAAYVFQYNSDSRTAEDDSPFLKEYKPFKSCPFNSLTWRIIHALMFAQVSLPDPPALSFVWRETVQRLRKHWEGGQNIPG
jgi:Rab3 GTPase-activating protein catalytic subunit